METHFALIGFGEAGQTFSKAGSWQAHAHVFDLKTTAPATAAAMLAQYRALGVTGCADLEAALACAPFALSLVTADQALAAARAAASCLPTGALYFDMNSVAPDTKREAATLIAAAGGRYVDVAIMAPVNPAHLAVPLLLSGPHAEDGADMLKSLGFTNIRTVGDEVGRASSIKMIRSVMVKGMEALSAECMLAAHRAGVTEDVLASLGGDWATKADYNLDRMLVHGLRRAAEMEEVAKTLDGLGVTPHMTAGTVARQRELGALGCTPAPDGLEAKLDIIESKKKEAAE